MKKEVIVAMHPLALWRVAERYRPDDFADLRRDLAPVIDANREKVIAEAVRLGCPLRADQWGAESVMGLAAMMAAQQFVRDFYDADKTIDARVRTEALKPLQQSLGLARKASGDSVAVERLDAQVAHHEAHLDIDRARRHARWGGRPVRRDAGAPINWQVQIRNLLTISGLDEVVAQRHAKALMRSIGDIPKS